MSSHSQRSIDPPVWYTFEPFERKPHDLFFLSRGSVRLFGQKTPIKLPRISGAEERKCCLIDKSMVLGLAQREQVFQHGITVFFHPLAASERDELFRDLATDPQTDLYYPFPYFAPGSRDEHLSSPDFWKPSPERVLELDEDERPIRELIVRLLAGFDLRGKVLFDPACSTGKFLCTLREHYPGVRLIGQDRSREMADFCIGKLDEVHCGDAQFPVIPEESVDFVFLRFLNFDVTSVAAAHELFAVNARRCRIGGYILVVGHTPILISSQWFECLGLKVERRTAWWTEASAVLQFYWLRRVNEVRDLPFVPRLSVVSAEPV